LFIIRALLQNITLYSHLIPLFLFSLFLLRNKQLDIRVILFYCLYSFINDFLILRFSPNQRFVLLSLFTVIEYSAFALVIYLNLTNNFFRKFILIISPFFIAFSIFQFLRSEDHNIDSLSITVEYILIIIYCLLYFFEKINDPATTLVYSFYTFWIIVGILIYATGTFFFFMQSKEMSDEEWNKWLIINIIFTIIKNLFFSIAITMKKKVHGQNNLNRSAENLLTPNKP